jgi:hypothetical protein
MMVGLGSVLEVSVVLPHNPAAIPIRRAGHRVNVAKRPNIRMA